MGLNTADVFETSSFERRESLAEGTLRSENSPFKSVSQKKVKPPSNGWHTDEEGTSFYRKRKKMMGWQEIEESTYHFDETGFMSKGWFDDGDYYYLSLEDGARVEGLKTIDSEQYYFNPEEGNMATSRWITLDDKRYYMTDSGNSAKNLYTVDGSDYYFDEITGEFLVDTSKPVIALTFDDGPSEMTEELLDFLKKSSIKSTFFLLGKSIPGNEDKLKRIYEEGHTVGSHSYNHPKFIELNDEEIRWQIEETDRLIYDVIGSKANFFRSPYGLTNSNVEALLGKPTILWSIDSEDWQGHSADEIRDSLFEDAMDGGIVLMHDTYSSSISALKMVVPLLQDRGFQFVSIETFFKVKGQTPEKDGVYYNF